jgi:hypothetical protein
MIEVPLDDTRVAIADRIQLIQDVAGALILMPAAFRRLQSGDWVSIMLGVVEAIAIVLAVLSARSELRGKHESSKYVDWTNLFVAAAMMLEYAYGLTVGRKVFSPLITTAVVMVVLAFMRPKMLARRRARRVMRISDEGLAVRFNKWRGLDLKWADVAAVSNEPNAVRFHLTDGTTREIPLRFYRNREEVSAAIFRVVDSRNV